MKWIKKIILFALVLFLYFLPSLIFKTDLEFYNSLKGPKLPSIVFPIVWTVTQVLQLCGAKMRFFNKTSFFIFIFYFFQFLRKLIYF